MMLENDSPARCGSMEWGQPSSQRRVAMIGEVGMQPCRRCLGVWGTLCAEDSHSPQSRPGFQGLISGNRRNLTYAQEGVP